MHRRGSSLVPADSTPGGARPAVGQRRFVIVDGVTFADFLICNPTRGAVVSSETVRVAKPFHLRVSPFNGITYGGVVYSYTSTHQRTATPPGGSPRIERLTPAYTTGEVITASYRPGGNVRGVLGALPSWIDDNRDARRFQSEVVQAAGGVAQFRVVANGDFQDVILCEPWDGVAITGPQVFVARPPALRYNRWSGQTINGITYTAANFIRRQARDSAQVAWMEFIDPPYRVGDLIYAAANVSGGTSTTQEGSPVIWLDINADARRFVRETIPHCVRFRLVNGSDYGDHLQCAYDDAHHGAWNGPSPTLVWVAKAYLLRRSPFNGLTRNQIFYQYSSPTRRTANGPGASEIQVIVPRWVAGDEIWATYGFSTGSVFTFNNEPVVFLDDNRSAHEWAREDPG